MGNIRTKRGAIIGTYIRIDRNTSTEELHNEAILEKKQELLTLGYPVNFINNIQKARKFTSTVGLEPSVADGSDCDIKKKERPTVSKRPTNFEKVHRFEGGPTSP